MAGCSASDETSPQFRNSTRVPVVVQRVVEIVVELVLAFGGKNFAIKATTVMTTTAKQTAVNVNVSARL